MDQEKVKIKESYEQIYRRIYEENNRLKKDFEAKETELKIEKAETESVKLKYQTIFTEISQQFQQIKLQYNRLIDESSR